MNDIGPNPRDAKGLCLLSLDGGGVRGLSTLFILRDLMNQLNYERGDGRHVKPCELFDLIGGTSTGGLIAIMLGRLELDVNECIEAYTELMTAVFGEKISNVPVDWSGNIKAQFDSKKLKAAIEHVVAKAGFSPTDLMDDGSSRSTRVFVCTTAKDTLKVTRLRSYAVSNEDTVSASICEAALATSAATGFFDAAKIGDQQFVDGAFGANNPVEEVEEEAADIWCTTSREIKPLVKCFVTLGTGCPARVPMNDNMFKFLSKTLVTLATKPESTERRFMARWSNESKTGRLFRFNVEQGLQEVHMTDCSKRGLIESATLDYLHHLSQKGRIRNCILNLTGKEERTALDFDLLMREHEARIFYAKLRDSNPAHHTYTQGHPPPCWAVPFEQNAKFVDREHVNNIKRKLFTKDQTQSMAIVGLGGVGKTQIALEVAHQARKLFPDCSVLWVPAVDMESLEQAYHDIAFKLGLSFDPKTDDVKIIVQTHLTHKHQGRWLMIFDNADELDMWVEGSSDPQCGGLRGFLPKGSRGAIVFTTRSNKVAQYLSVADTFRIAELDEQKATKVLHNSLKEKSLLDDVDSTRSLLESLTYLPLAIVQAASFINENEMSIASYVKILDGQDRDVINLLSEEFEDEGRYKSIRNPVATTWLTSFSQISRVYPLASFYMCFMSCISSKDIPIGLLPSHPSLPSTPHGPDQQKALGVLISYSFLRARSNGARFDMHRLVHLATKNWLRSSGLFEGWQNSAINILLAHFPSSDRVIERRATLPHALIALKSPSDGPTTEDRIRLLGMCAAATFDDGRIVEAIELFHQAINDSEKILGPESVETITLYGNLGYAYHAHENVRKGIKILERALREETRIRGGESKMTTSLQSKLSTLYDVADEKEKAEEFGMTSLRYTLRDWHPGVHAEDRGLVASLNSITRTYISQGRIYEAEKASRLALDLSKRFLKADDPLHFSSFYTLATCYMWQMKMKEAEELYTDLLSTEKSLLGPEHPTVLSVTYQLAVVLKAQLKHDEAVALLTECARLETKVHGADHPVTITTYKVLKDWTSRKLSSRLRCVFPHIERSYLILNLRKMYPKQKVYWGLYNGHRRKRDDSFVSEIQSAVDQNLCQVVSLQMRL